ncbi:hypothetical protein ATANTOWER_018845, partial [Ataeniobius toweri]|nr:hypothetical protein [Ataeniobius toweri]
RNGSECVPDEPECVLWSRSLTVKGYSGPIQWLMQTYQPVADFKKHTEEVDQKLIFGPAGRAVLIWPFGFMWGCCLASTFGFDGILVCLLILPSYSLERFATYSSPLNLILPEL